jgi:predicted adenine nucleotide alpha hydrolase (AANH) superfamily ATPase
MEKKRLLLHTCCAPCLTQCLNVLTGLDNWEKALPENPIYGISVFFYNPNLFPVEEYDKRKKEVSRYLGIFSKNNFLIETVDDNSASRREAWDQSAVQFKNEPEKGKRCFFCYEFRLEETFIKAKELNYDCVATTLTLSPWKDADKVNEAGMALSKKYGLEYIFSDFKKNNGFKKSADLCEKYGIYRQNYCGCRYSLNTVKAN